MAPGTSMNGESILRDYWVWVVERIETIRIFLWKEIISSLVGEIISHEKYIKQCNIPKGASQLKPINHAYDSYVKP